MNLTKLIPFNIRIKSLYWVRKEKEIDSYLTILFGKIDDDFYSEARVLLEELRDKWTPISHEAPEWFVMEYIPQFSKAESMFNFLSAPLDY
jgi:hypothetical protein